MLTNQHATFTNCNHRAVFIAILFQYLISQNCPSLRTTLKNTYAYFLILFSRYNMNMHYCLVSPTRIVRAATRVRLRILQRKDRRPDDCCYRNQKHQCYWCSSHVVFVNRIFGKSSQLVKIIEEMASCQPTAQTAMDEQNIAATVAPVRQAILPSGAHLKNVA